MLCLAKFELEIVEDTYVKTPLKMLNRHSIAAGANSIEKTIALQTLTENPSKSGVPSLIMDINGDFNEVAMAGSSNPKGRRKNIYIET